MGRYSTLHIFEPRFTDSGINFQLSHGGATFYTLLWKTRHFMGDWFKPTARFKVLRFEVK